MLRGLPGVGRLRLSGDDQFIPHSGELQGVDINLGLAPEIAELRGESLAGRRALLGDVGNDIQTLRGLENPFTQARVQPFIAARERAQRDAARRGVSGPLSALATNPFDAQIAEQGALATFDTQTAIRQGQELTRTLLSDISGTGQELLKQEMALLGLAAEEINSIIASQLERPTVQTGLSEGQSMPGIITGESIGAIVGGIGAMMCWVAREVYGEDNPRWMEFREWLLHRGPRWFRRLYLTYGKAFAWWIRDKPRIKRVVKWGMEKVLNHG